MIAAGEAVKASAWLWPGSEVLNGSTGQQVLDLTTAINKKFDTFNRDIRLIQTDPLSEGIPDFLYPYCDVPYQVL